MARRRSVALAVLVPLAATASAVAACNAIVGNDDVTLLASDGGGADGARPQGDVGPGTHDGPPPGADAPGTDSETPDAGADVPVVVTCAPSPENFDVPGNNCDDDGNGKVDDTPPCDTGLAAAGDAESFARALGICQTQTPTQWGLVSAAYSAGWRSASTPNAAQHSILPKFGDIVRPLEGTSLGVLSSGFATEYDGPGADGGNTPFNPGVQMQAGAGAVPPGFPVPTSGCPAPPSGQQHDVIDVALSLQVPANAHSFEVSFDFYSSEWPTYVCSSFNDSFIVYYTPGAADAGANVAFDGMGNPINVNAAYVDRCTPGVTTGCGGTGPMKLSTCSQGTSELGGTGFLNLGMWCPPTSSSGGAATGWRAASATVTPGSTITVELMIWDTGDTLLDSNVLLDDFHWKP